MMLKFCLQKSPLLLLLAVLLGLLPVPVSAVAAPALDSYCRELHVSSAAPAEVAEKPFLGVAFEAASPQMATGLSACPKLAKVTSMIKGSAARKAGIEVGDVILSLDDQIVCLEKAPAGPGLRAALAGKKIGDTVALVLLRNGERLERAAQLGAKPRHRAAETARSAPSCPQGSSRLLKVLEEKSQTQRFNNVSAALADRADQLHNLDAEQPASGNPRQLREFTSLMRHPLRAGLTARLLSEPFLAAGNVLVPAAAGLLAAMADITPPPVSPPRETNLPALVAELEAATVRINALLTKLAPADLEVLRAGAIDSEEGEAWNRFVAVSLKFDLPALVEALLPLVGFFSDEGLANLRQDLLERFPESSTGLLYKADSAAGLILVGGTGKDSYNTDAALILDLGGDDLYRNNAGGSRPGLPVAVVIDWAGDDRYLAENSFSQGAGLLGGGCLLDLSGRDLFVALDGSQGAGLFGVGMLRSDGQRAEFHGRRFCQGVGLTGLGLLSGGKGATLYRGGEKGQGFGAFGGVGVLVDADGDDNYQLGGLRPDFRDPQRATVSMGQGFGYGIRADGENTGISGGLGLLLDAGGDDTYLADYFAQGASYYFGLGILRDLAGNDRYLAGRYAQGAGIHASVGVLLDEGGDDSYHASVGVAQGLGHDYGFGLLQDDAGNDRYDGGSLLQGAATIGGLGVLLDAGGRDAFETGGKCGGYAEDETGLGVLLKIVMSDYSVPAE